jgi:hypothetical protein
MSDLELATAEIDREIVANNRTCPKCNCGLVRTKGCDYVICPKCQSPFCFACGAEMPKGTNTCPSHTCDKEGFKKAAIIQRAKEKQAAGSSPLRNEIRITVRTETGPCIALQIPPSETIGELKTKIAAKTGTEVSKQRLSFAGKPLSDDSQSITVCQIREKSTIVLSQDVAGGRSSRL